MNDENNSKEPYADIHFYDANRGVVPLDDEGDPMNGYYFQFMQDEEMPLSEMIGPYSSHEECEGAAIREWQSA